MLDHGRSAWLPKADERWADYVTRRAPPAPSFWSIGERASYKAALEEAIRRGEHRVAHDALIFPLWVGNNDDEEPRDDIWVRHVIVWSEGELLFEADRVEGPAFWASTHSTAIKGSFVGMGTWYPAGSPVQRVGPYAIAERIVRVVVDEVEACTSVPALPAPSKVVPAFSSHVALAMEPHALPPDVTKAIDAAIARLQIINVVLVALAVGCTGKSVETSSPPAAVSIQVQVPASATSTATASVAPSADASASASASAIPARDDCMGADLANGTCRCAHQRCMDICCPAGWTCSHPRTPEGGFAKCLRPR